MKNILIRLWQEQEGQDLTEYALLLVLLSCVATASIGTFATTIKGMYTSVATNVT